LDNDDALMELIHAIVADDHGAVVRLLRSQPGIEHAKVTLGGATRLNPTDYFLDDIQHHVYGGDTALHLAAAAHRVATVRRLLQLGADVAARNRRKAQPLHYAVDGGPGIASWSARSQEATVRRLLDAGADPNSFDGNGTSPLHRAIRNRASGAVRILLDRGADPTLPNGKGSTSLELATWTTGKSGSGSRGARHAQQKILAMLQEAASEDRLQRRK
jgi:ankyrin repeat protein